MERRGGARHVAMGFVLLACMVPRGAMAQAGPPATEPTDSASEPAGRTSWVVLPALFYTPETRMGGGGALFLNHRPTPSSRPTSGHISALYTQERQILFGLSGEGYSRSGANRLSGYVGFERFPTTFYGLGNDSPQELAEDYTPRVVQLRVSGARRVRRGLRIGASYEVARWTLVEVAEGGMLDQGTVPGAAGGTAAGPGLVVSWDDRDNIYAPTRGSYHTLNTRIFGRASGSDYSFSSHALDLRHYRELRPGHVLAFHGHARATTGSPPFRMMPSLGGQNLMRGYFGGRFTDRHALAAQTEYRAHVWWRFGAVAFAGAGQVASRPGDVRIDALHVSGGAGLRFLLDPREQMKLRIDYGVAAGGTSGLYITVTEAF